MVNVLKHAYLDCFFKSLGDEMNVPSVRVGYWCLE